MTEMLAVWPFALPGLFIAGAIGVSVPILIHLLNRRRFKIRQWAAMKFLLDSIRKNRRRLQIEEMILLAIRCLVVLLIGMTLARFTGCSIMPDIGGESSATVYILDDSVSMGQTLGSDTLCKVAAADLSREIERLASQNKAAIVLTSKPRADEPFCPMDFLTEKNSLMTRLAELKAGDTVARLDKALEAAATLLAHADNGKKRVVIYSDFRTHDLASSENRVAIQKQFAALKNSKVELFCFDYGRDGKDNLTLEKIELLDKVAVAGMPARMAVTIRNNGARTANDVEVAFTGQVQVSETGAEYREISPPSRKFDTVGPNESKRMEFAFTFNRPGSAVITAKLPGDELRGDDAASLALGVRDAVRVLVVDGAPDLTDKSQSEAYFFAKAIDPNGDGAFGYLAETALIDNFDSVDSFAPYDMVVLMNVAAFPLTRTADNRAFAYAKLESLEKFVRSGGGLVIFSGDKIDNTFYDALYAHGAGLLPYKLGVRQDAPAEKFFRLDPKKLAADPMLRTFQGEGAGFTELVRFYSFTRSDETVPPIRDANVKPPRVLARFNDENNSIAIATRQYGQGSVVLFTTAGSARWNDWPLAEMDTYNLVMLDMLPVYAKAQQSLSDEVGTPINYAMSSEQASTKITIKLPDYPTHDEVSLKEKDGRLKFDMTSQAGIYRLELAGSGTQEVLLARNVSPAEGQLAAGGEQALSALFGSSFQYIRRSSSAGSESGIAGGREYWQWILAALLCLVALEVFLGQRFGHYT